MSVRTKTRLVFLGMFLAMFACGALGGRLGMWLGIHTLLVRNGLAVLSSYVSFLLMMWFYIRALRSDPVFLREVAMENAPSYGKMRGDDGGFFNSLDFDFDGWMVLIAVLALILLVGIWIGIEGPALLMDEASAVAIGAGLAGRGVLMMEPSWLRRVVFRTIWQVAIYLAFSSILMGYADVKCPGRPGLSAVVKECVLR
jgi:hypothetical protein